MSGVAEAALTVLLETLLDKMLSSILKRSGGKKVPEEMKKWEQILKDLHATIHDGEIKHTERVHVREWVENLEHLAYDVEDMLDEYRYELLFRKAKLKFMAGFSLKARRFNHRMLSMVKDIAARLEDLNERKKQLDLLGRDDASTSHGGDDCVPYSGPLLAEAVIYGREEEKQRIIRQVGDAGVQKICVIPVVGMGGVGKSTLARHVYNDEEVRRSFDVTAWIRVSCKFDIMRICKAILEAVTSSPCEFKDPHWVQVRLHAALQDKKFLIVLDDLWNESVVDWESFKAPFKGGAPGSKILVTTRSFKVADIVRTVDKFETLRPLSDEHSWSLFCMQAGINDESRGLSSSMEEIGKKIVKRCSGLPLAVMIMGGLLRWKDKEEEWQATMLRDAEADIMSCLRRSYKELPSQIKRCFAFCALFPDDYRFTENDVVLMWLGAGLIQWDEITQNIDDSKIGHPFFGELVAKSMLLSQIESQFDIPNLLLELARQISGSSFRVMEELHQPIQWSRTRHLSFIRSDAEKIITDLCLSEREESQEVLPLRTFLPLERGHRITPLVVNDTNYLFSKMRNLRVLSLNCLLETHLPHSISKLTHLRYLDLSYSNIASLPKSIVVLRHLEILILRFCPCLLELPEKIGLLINLRYLNLSSTKVRSLPEAIGKLKQLKYLNVSSSKITTVPDSTTTLHNLEVLILSYCENLERLPEEVGNLTSLCHLDINCSKLACEGELPPGIERLRRLQKLSNFIVGTKGGLTISAIGNLHHLQGELSVSRLENIGSPQEARSAQLREKRLATLKLHWSQHERQERGVDSVLEELQPSRNLKELTISGYGGQTLPSWLASTSLKILRIKNCHRIASFPANGLPTSIQEMYISNSPKLGEQLCRVNAENLKLYRLPRIFLDGVPLIRGR